MNLVIHDFGSKCAIGIKGACEEEIEAIYNSFYNHEAVNVDISWLSEHFGYFWTTRIKLLKTLENIERAKILNSFPDEEIDEKELSKTSKQKAKEIFEGIPHEHFIRINDINEKTYRHSILNINKKEFVSVY